MTDKRVPTAWIATGPNGRVLHFAVEDGWTVDAVMHEPLPPLDPQPSAPVAGEDAKLIGASMKLDEEMREEAMRVWRANWHASGGAQRDAIFEAGYRMGLERAARKCDDADKSTHPADLAAAIREMAHD